MQGCPLKNKQAPEALMKKNVNFEKKNLRKQQLIKEPQKVKL